MINWVAVLQRILRLYGAMSQQELGMALGIPVNIHPEGGARDVVIPWEILAMVVDDKQVSWDWLLTGNEFRGGRRDNDAPGHPIQKALNYAESRERRMPRVETRELVRTLLPRDDASERPEQRPEHEAEPASGSSGETRAEMVRRLESLKTSVQDEIEKVERLLDDGTGRR